MILWFRHVVGFWCYGHQNGMVVTEVVFVFFVVYARCYKCVHCMSFFCICSLFDMCCLLA